MGITLTESAANHVQSFLQNRGKGMGLRLAVKTTGCSGMAYVLEFADEINPEDKVFEDHGVKVIVDPKSLLYIDGTELDYTKEGLNEGFKFNNPLEASTFTVFAFCNFYIYSSYLYKKRTIENTMATAGNSHNYFELFGLPESYDLDLTELSNRYRTLQNTVHPDKFANASDLERRLSMQQSALINEAYQTLKTPLRRAQYMLLLKGVDLSVDTRTSMDSEFLMQQMRLREELEQVRHCSDPAARLMMLSAEIEKGIAEQDAILKQLFADAGAEKLEQITNFVRRMQFMVKLRQEAEALEEELI